MRFAALALIVFMACKPSSQSQSLKEDVLQQIVTKELGEKSTVSRNTDLTFALAYLGQDATVQFIVVRLADHQVVMKDKIRGSVSWDGPMRIKESLIPGMVKKDSKPEDYTRIIDLTKYLVQSK